MRIGARSLRVNIKKDVLSIILLTDIIYVIIFREAVFNKSIEIDKNSEIIHGGCNSAVGR